MSAFEKLPREIRDLIYGCCLLYDGEIIPFPDGYEMNKIIGGLPDVENTTRPSPQNEPTRTSELDVSLGSMRGVVQN